MDAKARRRRAHFLAYQLLQQALNAGVVSDHDDDADESPADKRSIAKLLEGMARWHLDRAAKP